MTDPHHRAAEIARDAYGKLLAIVARHSGDIAAAEELLSEAFQRALETWPVRGEPANPEGWLVAVARNRLRDRLKSAAHRTRVSHTELDELASAAVEGGDLVDRRLELLFVCAHPAIDSALRTPLMLQTVLGFDAESIGAAFGIAKVAMAQRLVRAKRKIKAAQIPFVVPEAREMPGRLEAVLEAIYGAYSLQLWDPERSGEALYLADLVVRLLPDEPEVLGLASLLGFISSRETARVRDGVAVPLTDQDPADWDHHRIDMAEELLHRARSFGTLGRFQLEAAIHSAHCERRHTGTTQWGAVLQLYEGLLQLAPTIGAAVARAAAVGEAVGPEAGLAALEAVDNDAQQTFQPAWATRAHLLARLGRHDEARQAFDHAIALTREPVDRAYLQRARSVLL